ncbi:MAG: hypothetical protein R3E01_21980 [Pirellulaceae bacterium]|nr:hypothetical protein [Planctomycetales bacterium]
MISYLTNPVFSAMLLVLAGALICHAMWISWHRVDRTSPDDAGGEDDQRELHETIRQLELQLDDERASRSQLHVDYQRLMADLDAIQQQHNELRELQQQLSAAHTEEESAELRKLLDFKRDALIGLEQERHRRASLEMNLRIAEKDVRRLRIDADHVGRLRQQNKQLRGEVRSAQEEIARLTASAKDATEAIEKSQETTTVLRKAMEQLRVTADRLQRERDELGETLRRERAIHRDIEQTLQAKTSALQKISNEARALRVVRERQALMQTRCEEDAQRMMQLVEELNRVRETEQAARAEICDLQSRLDHWRGQKDEATAQQQELLKRCRDEHEKRVAIESSISTMAQKVEQLEALPRQLRELREKNQQLATLLHRQTKELTELSRQRDSALAAEAQVRDAMARQRDRMERIDAAETQRDQMLEELKRVRSEQARLMVVVKRDRERMRRLEGRSQALDSLRSEYRKVKETLVTMEPQFEQLQQERDSAMVDSEHAAKTIAQLRARLGDAVIASRAARQRKLESLRAEAETRLRAEMGAEDEGFRHDPVLGLIYTAKPDHIDDLKQISGVADWLERKLNSFGVYTYAQIMRWDASAIDEFSRMLSFRERIRRDDWVGQARRLFEQQHGDRSHAA